MTPILEKVLNELEDLKSNTLTETVSGTELTITDSANARIRDIKIYGDIEQDGEPSPDEPIDIQIVTGDVTVTLSDGETEKAVELNLGDLELYGNDEYGRDYIYKKNGKWYKHCAWKRITLDGINYTVEGLNSTDSVQNLTLGIQFFYNTNVSTDFWASIKCYYSNRFRGKTYGHLCTMPNIIAQWGTELHVSVSANTFANIAEANQYFQENETYIIGLLNKETDEEITDKNLIKQLDKLYNLKVYQTTTSIYTETDNLNPALEIEYVLDLKTYINNKIAELTT